MNTNPDKIHGLAAHANHLRRSLDARDRMIAAMDALLEILQCRQPEPDEKPMDELWKVYNESKL